MRRMLIDLGEPEESRIAVMENGRLEEIHVERRGKPTLVGNIYKGKVVNIESGIQAAFVEFGHTLKGFLHVSDVTPGALPNGGNEDPKANTPRRRSIQNLLRKGMEVMVQVTKDGVGKKGPALTMQISLPGRVLVVMPFLLKHGVSRKIEDDEERKRLKEILLSLSPPQDLGFIVRTAGKERRKADLQRDLRYLLRVWEAVKGRMKEMKGPGLLYQETDLMVRTIRDFFSPEVDTVLVNSEEGYRRARDFFRIAMPRYRGRVKLYEEEQPLFQRFGVEPELAKVFNRQVVLSLGGSIVIDTTEAMVTIDVNSGRFTDAKDAEQMALRINKEAAREIARQLQLRDLGGLIVTDFIDMRLEKNCREVEKTFREALKQDRARLRTLRMSKFCLIEMTRQRLRPSLNTTHFDRCEACTGTGWVINPETLGARIIRRVRYALSVENVVRLEIRAHEDIAFFLLNEMRGRLAELEQEAQKRVEVQAVACRREEFEIVAFNERGKVVKV